MALAINSIASQCKSSGDGLNAFDRAFLDECRRNGATCIERQRLLNAHHQHGQVPRQPLKHVLEPPPEHAGDGAHSYVNSYFVHFQQQQIQHQQQNVVNQHERRHRCFWVLALVAVLILAILSILFVGINLDYHKVYSYLFMMAAIFAVVAIIILVGRRFDRFDDERRGSNYSEKNIPVGVSL